MDQIGHRTTVKVDSALLLPTQLDHEAGLGIALPAFDAAGAPLDAVVLRRRYGRTGTGAAAPMRELLSGEHIYGGYLNPHFGHFLLEALARTSALRARPDLPVLWHGWGTGRLTSWQRDIFELLGIDCSRFRIVDVPLTVERLLVPSPGYEIPDHADAAYIEALAVYPHGDPRPGRRVWLSRSALPESAGRVIGEEHVERQLAALGWSIVHPELLPVRDQLDAFAGAEAIAGFAGSAFHLLLLARHIRSRVFIVGRGTGPLNRNFQTIAEAKGLDQTVVEIPQEYLSGNGHKASFRLLDPRGLVARLEMLTRDDAA